MKRLYNLYGKDLVLLDATYRTTKYTAPVFFLVVRTNCNYQIAAVIILQEESAELITKSLEKIKGNVVNLPLSRSNKINKKITLIKNSIKKVKFYDIVSEWNPGVTPKYAMIDYDHSEMIALQSVFPTIKIYLCDFHREQAWHRYFHISYNISILSSTFDNTFTMSEFIYST